MNISEPRGPATRGLEAVSAPHRPIPAFLLTFSQLRSTDGKKENAILAEKALRLTPADLQRGRVSRRGLAALAVLPLLGVVAAFGIAPDTATETVVLHRVVQEMRLPFAVEAASEASAQYWREEPIQRGDTIGS